LKKRDPDSANNRARRLREASQQRREQEKQEVRQVILSASSELFLEHGYQHFSLRQVAERIGYSPGTIYLYFKDKDAILFTIVEEGAAQFSRMLSEAAQTADLRERLYRIGHTYVQFGLQYPAHYQLMFMQRTDFLERSVGGLPQPMIEIFQVWNRVVEDSMKAGILRMGDPGSTGDTLWALLHGVVSIAVLMPRFDEKRTRAMTETALELLTQGLHR
jgi:AcrR family transcriptional regulator